MLLTVTTPGDWRDLQNSVARILIECGFTVHKEHPLKTVRGSVELDVYAHESIDGRSYSLACECKQWTSRVPQTVVHAFRTVIADIGINSGYIVSSNGFQSGAFEACQNTNLELLTWPEFQVKFSQTWLENYLSPTLQKELDPILSYTEPLVPPWFMQVPEHEVQTLRRLRQKYVPFGILIMMFMPYASFRRSNGFPKLPLRSWFNESGDALPDLILDAVGYREFMDASIEFGKRAIEEFDEVRRRNLHLLIPKGHDSK